MKDYLKIFVGRGLRPDELRSWSHGIMYATLICLLSQALETKPVAAALATALAYTLWCTVIFVTRPKGEAR